MPTDDASVKNLEHRLGLVTAERDEAQRARDETRCQLDELKKKINKWYDDVVDERDRLLWERGFLRAAREDLRRELDFERCRADAAEERARQVESRSAKELRERLGFSPSKREAQDQVLADNADDLDSNDRCAEAALAAARKQEP